MREYLLFVCSALITIVGQILLTVSTSPQSASLPESQPSAISSTSGYLILVVGYALWSLTFLAYIKKTKGSGEANNAAHMRFVAVFSLFMFYISQYVYSMVSEYDTIPRITFTEYSSFAIVMTASMLFVSASLYPKLTWKQVYGTTGSLMLLNSAIVTFGRKWSQNVSVACAMILIIIQASLLQFNKEAGKPVKQS